MASRRLLVWTLAAALGTPLSAQPPRPLSRQSTANLTAFARLLALVRFFHPSDAVAAADWNRVAVAGVGAVEGAEDPAALALALEGFFRPLAPTLRVYPQGPQGQRPETPRELRQPAGRGPFRIVTWRH